MPRLLPLDDDRRVQLATSVCFTLSPRARVRPPRFPPPSRRRLSRPSFSSPHSSSAPPLDLALDRDHVDVRTVTRSRPRARDRVRTARGDDDDDDAMTVDFLQRKRSKREAKKARAASRVDENGRRIRGKKGPKRALRGMCANAPPTPPALREEDEREEARRSGEKRRAERERVASKALRKKMRAAREDLKTGDEAMGEMEGGGEIVVGGEGSAVPDYFMDAMKSIGHRRTTPVQRGCWPAACAGKDVLAIAPPGSGKTLGFLLPAIEVALRDLRENPNAGKKYPGSPAALVVAPTRELTLQISTVCNKLKKAVPVRSVAVYGGVSQEDQEEALGQHTSHAFLVIGTPGRLNAVLESGALKLDRCKILVLDEADRMLALGFEEQLLKIRDALPNANDGRQTLLFSATFPKAVRTISKSWLGEGFETVKIEVADGKSGTMAGKSDDEMTTHMATVEQTVHVCAEHKKSRKLMKYITKLRAADGRARSRVLVFANRIKTVQFIAELCKRHNEKVSTLFGTMKQERRDQAMKDFKAGKTPVLIATDVAGRGLDIAGLEYVVNWDFPGSIEQYRHRVGRAGRQGKRGAALSFFTRKFAPLAGDLIELLKKGDHFVDPNLEILAKVAASLPKTNAKSVKNADRFNEDPADEHGELEVDEEEDENNDAEKKPAAGKQDDWRRGEHVESEAGDEEDDDGDMRRKKAWWNSDKSGRGGVFVKKFTGSMGGKRKVSVGPSAGEIEKKKKRSMK